MHDVALAAGVSVATVSRVLNAQAGVRDATAQSVAAAARALNFRPNLVGRQLRSVRTRTLGVLLPALDHPVFAECLQAIESSALAHGWTMAVASTGYHAEAEDAACERLLRQRVDGLVLTVADATHSPVLAKLDAEAVPYRLAFHHAEAAPGQTPRPCVGVDNRAAAADMVRHLHALGHRHIQMVRGPLRQSDRARQRFEGYVQAQRAAGLPASPALEIDWLAPEATAVLRACLGQAQPPTALFCANDQLALAVVRDLRALGLRVPEDVSVAGFDGVHMGAWLSPALTTVVQPVAEIGRRAVAHLIAGIEGAPSDPLCLLPCHLRTGGTAAPPPDCFPPAERPIPC